MVTDLALVFSTAAIILYHTSLYQLANGVAIQQTLGKSEVCCLHSDTGGHWSDLGNPTPGTPHQHLKWALMSIGSVFRGLRLLVAYSLHLDGSHTARVGSRFGSYTKHDIQWCTMQNTTSFCGLLCTNCQTLLCLPTSLWFSSGAACVFPSMS